MAELHPEKEGDLNTQEKPYRWWKPLDTTFADDLDYDLSVQAKDRLLEEIRELAESGKEEKKLPGGDLLDHPIYKNIHKFVGGMGVCWDHKIPKG